MQLNEAVSRRLVELMQERGMTQYQLYMKSGVPKSTIGNLVNCAYPSMKLRIIHELCQGLELSLIHICEGVIGEFARDDYAVDLFNRYGLEQLIGSGVAKLGRVLEDDCLLYTSRCV